MQAARAGDKPILLSVGYLESDRYYQGEYYFLLLASALGAVVMASSRDFLTMIVALELVSGPAFLMAAWRIVKPSLLELSDRGVAGQAVGEILTIGREAGLPVQITHVKLALRSLHGQTDRLLGLLDEARAAGSRYASSGRRPRFLAC